MSSFAFELYILAAIVLNSVIIGIESELTLRGEELPWAADVEIVLLAIYTMEIILRVLAGGLKIFYEGWFLFDLCLVFFSYIERIVASFAGEAQQQIMVLRLLRLFRLIRSFRMIKQIKPLWRLVHGLMASMDTVVSTLMLLLLLGEIMVATRSLAPAPISPWTWALKAAALNHETLNPVHPKPETSRQGTWKLHVISVSN